VSEQQLVSRYAAAGLLGRDRQTIERAVRNLPPDAYHKGQPRWRLERIAQVLAMTPQQRRDAGKARDRYGIRAAELDEMRRAFERGVADIAAAPIDRRRAMALALAPLLQRFQVTYLDIGRRLHIADDDVLTARSEMIFSELMDEVSEASHWPRYGNGADFFITMLKAMPSTDDDEAA
jgi:hypothetical protein